MNVVLLCAVGETPQVVTETLYALKVHEHTVPTEVHVLTTETGRRKVLDHLLHRAHGHYYRFCRDYGVDHRLVRFGPEQVHVLGAAGGRGLEDLRTREENAVAAHGMIEFVRRQAARADVELHASLAGGRKTMSYFMGQAMQMYGRRRDRLTHVLVSEDFETHPDFYFPPRDPVTLQTRAGKQVRTDAAEVTLVEVPFLRLRDHLSPETIAEDFAQTVAAAQAQIDRPPELAVDPARGALRVGDTECLLGTTQLFALYLHLLFERRGSPGPGEGHFLPAAELLEVDNRQDRWIEAAAALGNAAAPPALGELLLTDRLNPALCEAEGRPERFVQGFSETVSKLNRRLEETWPQEAVLRWLRVDKVGRNPARYGVRLPVGRIRFPGEENR